MLCCTFVAHILKQVYLNKTIVFFIFLYCGLIAKAQESSDIYYKVTGRVIDASSNAAIPYATIVMKTVANDQILRGEVSDEEGLFNLRSINNQVYLELSFMGYESKVVRDIKFLDNVCNLDAIKLSTKSDELDEVVVRAEKSSIEFKLDKKVFNVGKDLSNAGGSATDVLNNVPSVNVDIEGNISLRGNSGVQILINGKPSVLADQGANALGSITADMIESIEVITNPSAKYEAGGTAGILNIVLKKENKKGLNGSASFNTGMPANHSVGMSLNYRTEKFNVFTQIGSGYRSLPRESKSVNENYSTQSVLKSSGTEYRDEQFHNIILGTDYYLNKLNVITLSGNFAYEIEDQPSTFGFIILDSSESIISSWARSESTSATNPKYQFDLQYKRQFKNNKEHVLLFSSIGKFFGKDLESEFNNLLVTGNSVTTKQKTETKFFQADYTWKLDYTNPISKFVTVETGSMFQSNNVGNTYSVYDWNQTEYVVDSSFSNDFRYDQKVLGAYGTGSYERKKFGVKLGLRSEYTSLNTLLVNNDQDNNQEYTKFFPTLHSSYKLSKFVSMQAGYSRRIYRPRLWDLNPFFNIRNNFDIRTGNPNLQPEFADSYELTGIFVMKKFHFNSSLYYLYKTEVIERVSTTIGNVSYTSPMNIGTSGKTGVELNCKYDLSKKVSFNADLNYGFFRRNGQFLNQSFDFSGDQFTSKITTKIKLPKQFDFEGTANVNSSIKTVQGIKSGFVFYNLGLRKKFKEGKFVGSINVRDLFASRIRENNIYQNDYYIYNFSKRGTFLTLSVSYGFGKGEAMTYNGRRHH